MNLENLKSSWKIYKVRNSRPILEEACILNLIENNSISQGYQPVYRLIQNISFFILLIIICQGG